ncbi:Ran-binding-domain-containing protein [Xylariaceae sp. FL0016]|nr:Ran-binding-domain-containing protein [Xylariaceae sp. FL0016]
MDAFLARLSYQATSYAIRSCLALTSTYVVKQSSKLLQVIDDRPLRTELGHLQRRLARKIEVRHTPHCQDGSQLVSPILESIELRFTRGYSALKTVVRTAQALRGDIESLGERLKAAALDHEFQQSSPKDPDSRKVAAARRVELESIILEIKEVITNIDDAVPLINLWVSAIGGIQAPATSFSPSRLLQASMLVNVGDMQFILDSSQPMQIGPDFTLSMYMLFRGHASTDASAEPYGLEEGQRKPMWQEVIHKARIKLCRVPIQSQLPLDSGTEIGANSSYAYQLMIVEDLDDGRVHNHEQGAPQPAPYDGVLLAGIRERLPICQISKMFYADVGRILNINNGDGASSNPVLLLKRDLQAQPIHPMSDSSSEQAGAACFIGDADNREVSNCNLSEGDSQDDIERQIQQEIEARGTILDVPITSIENVRPASNDEIWGLPPDLDPEWIALEVFEFDDEADSTDEDDPTPEDGASAISKHSQPKSISRPSADHNLITQLNRMNIASSRPSSLDSRPQSPTDTHTLTSNGVSPVHAETLLERSPFGAITTSLSLLEMLLRLTSLQEFEQTTHLAIPDHVLKFYLDESASSSGLHGRQRWEAGAEAERKVGFDPYADAAV